MASNGICEVKWPIVGVHGTTVDGAIGILESRRLKNGYWGILFFFGMADAMHAGVVTELWQKARRTPKNQSGLMFELVIWRKHGMLRSGGHEDEQKVCSAHGVCKYNGGGDRKRWTAHEKSVTVTAMWLEPTLDISQAVADFRHFEMPRR